jgi:hypothetical protein
MGSARADVRHAALEGTDGSPARPDARKEGQWPRLVKGEPDGRPAAVRQRSRKNW